jgi:hypothetical protein
MPKFVRDTQILGRFTTEALRARSKEFLMKKYSELCELCVSVVNYPFFFGCGSTELSSLRLIIPLASQPIECSYIIAHASLHVISCLVTQLLFRR